MPSVGPSIQSVMVSAGENKSLATDLAGDGVTPNDPGDLDVGGSNADGPNHLQNFPVLDTPIKLNATQFEIRLTAHSQMAITSGAKG